MTNNFYHQIINNLFIGYAYHRIICNPQGFPVDSQFIDANKAFEMISGLPTEKIIGMKITEAFPNIKNSKFNWIEFFGEIALNHHSNEIEHCIQPLNRWYRIHAYSPKPSYFITLIEDITTEKKDIDEKKLLLTTLHDIVFEISSDYYFTNVLVRNETSLFIPKNNIIGSRLTDIFTATVTAEMLFFFEVARTSHQKQNFEYKSPILSDERWFLAEIIYFDDKISPKFVVSIHDITEKKEHAKDLQETKEYLVNLIQYANAPIITWSPDFKITEFNFAFEQLTGRSRADVLGQHLKLLFPNASKLQTMFFLRQLANGERWESAEIPILHISGKERIVLWNKADIRNSEGQIIATIAQGQDITQRKLMEKSLFVEKERLQTTLLSIGDGVISTDAKGRVTLVNRVAEILTGWCQLEAYGRPLNEVLNLFDEDTRKPCDNPADYVLKVGEIVELNNHTILLSKNGREFPIEDSAAPIRDQDGQITGVVIVFRDCSDKKEKQAQIEYLSYHDHLTSLYNRRFFDEELSRLNTLRNLPLSLLIFDVNGLKLTNDAFGHIAGDRLLIEVANTMKSMCRCDDIIARIGGDEFAILLPKTEIDEAKKLAKRINTTLSQQHLEAGQISISSGWGVKTMVDETIEAVFKAAENKMYQYKISERNSIRNESIQFIMKTLYEKLPREQNHSEQVSKISGYIGSAMGLTNEEINELITAGSLHDIGKIAIDNEILDKADNLSAYEWSEIRRHPEISYSILSSVNDYAPLANIILLHHERFDGAGYPKGLAGKQIPIQARIIAIADAYDAMTYGRPYKKPMSIESAIKEIIAGEGTQFDPQIVKIFLKIIAKS